MTSKIKMAPKRKRNSKMTNWKMKMIRLQHVHNSFITCLWHVRLFSFSFHDSSIICSWLVTACSWLILNMFMIFLLLAFCSWIVFNSFMNCQAKPRPSSSSAGCLSQPWFHLIQPVKFISQLFLCKQAQLSIVSSLSISKYHVSS